MAGAVRLSESLVHALAFLLEKRAWCHGYEIMQATGVHAGTLYPLLVRLSDAGWVDAKWEQKEGTGRPPRHLYKLTSEGRRLARESLERAALRGWSPRPEASR